MTRTLIADPNPMMRGWLATALLRPPASVIGVSTGWEVLWHLARERFDLVVVGPRMPDVPGPSLLAMVRTAGLNTPFLLIAPFCRASVRASVKRLGGAEIVDDWSDTTLLRAARDRLPGAGGWVALDSYTEDLEELVEGLVFRNRSRSAPAAEPQKRRLAQ